MDMSQNEVSVFGSKMATLREKKRTPHFETSPYVEITCEVKTKQLHSHVEITCEVKPKP